jgi:hypothetical protein
MKVAIFGSFDNYGHMGNWVADAWEDNGHEVTRVDRSNTLPDNQDLIVFTDCSEDYSSKITDTKAIKVFWAMDTHMPTGTERSVNIARKCDIVFSTNYEHGVKMLANFGIKSNLLPITYSNRLVSMEPQDEDVLDVCMIGHANSAQRLDLWSILKEYNSFVGPASTEQTYVDAMSNCKIVINQPTEPWDIILNNRFFEALAFGKILLQKRLKTDLIEKMGFKNGRDFIYWESLEEIPSLIDRALDHEFDGIGLNNNVERYSINAQTKKMEDIVLSNFYNRINV